MPDAAVAGMACAPSRPGPGGDDARDTLFYDGQCPLCAAEIEALAGARGEALRLVDIHEQAPVGHDGAPGDHGRCPAGDGVDAPAAARPAPSVDQLLRTLHLQRADGSWLTGADANVAAWEGTRRGRLLRVLRWPLLRPFVDLAYRVWAAWRYRRLYGRQFITERHAPRSRGD